jgi:hypothetical protein
MQQIVRILERIESHEFSLLGACQNGNGTDRVVHNKCLQRAPGWGSLAPPCHKFLMHCTHFGYEVPRRFGIHRQDLLLGYGISLSVAVIINHLSGGVNSIASACLFWEDLVSWCPHKPFARDPPRKSR